MQRKETNKILCEKNLDFKQMFLQIILPRRIEKASHFHANEPSCIYIYHIY